MVGNPIWGKAAYVWNRNCRRFFAKCVLLVEGVGDKAIVEGWYAIKNRDPHAEGLVIAEVSGKNNLIKPAIIFEALGIPCYVLFDNDKSGDQKKLEQNKRLNKILQLMCGVDSKKIVEWPEGSFELFTSWDNKLEKYVEAKVGKAEFQKACAEFSAQWDIDPDMCLKFPASAAGILNKFCAAGTKFPELDEIIKCVDELMEK
jgi:putative ATP-dependent endonuclease of the OLD family